MPRETGRNIVDYRIPGVPLSAVEQQDTRRKDKVKQVLEKFENHPNKESFIQDFKQTKEINEFSKESQDLIADMSNTEIFELCETSSKQIATCIVKQALSILRAEDAQGSREIKEVDKNNNDAVSIPGYVIKKNNKRGARHGPSERQRNTTRPGRCCIKRVTRNMESTQPFM